VARILFLVWQLGSGGAERQLINLAKGLDRLGHSITIACWVPGGSYEGALAGTQIKVELLLERRVMPGLGMATLARRGQRLVNAFRPHVIHGYMDQANLLAALLRSPEPGARTVWGIRASNPGAYDFFAKAVHQINRLTSRRADLIIANSAAGAAHVAARGYPKQSLRVIHNGIDTDLFRYDAASRARLRAEWGVAAGERVVGIASRLDPIKGYDTFIAAARLLAGRRSDVRFVCVGEGIEPWRSEVLASVQRAGLGERFLWRGFMAEPQAFYSALDVATSSSVSESFSNSVAEAMACGVPCAVTDVGESAAIVADTGEVVPVGDAQALAAAWQRILEGPTERPSARCRARIVERFSIARLVAETEAAILPPGLRRLAAAA
jgi:glycosyltransferase involved in cell wall biosynthesis